MEFVKPDHLDIARYITYLFNEKATYSKIETAFYAIKWKLDCSPHVLYNPCDKKFVHLLLDGTKRILARPVVHKEPITPEMLTSIVKVFDNNELKGVRTCAMFLICFAGFLRFNELAGLRLCDVELCDSHVKLFLEKSKTDQFREGAWVVISATFKCTCPVAMLKKYISLANFIDMSSDDFLFRPISFCKTKSLYILRSGNLPVSYTRCREILKEAIQKIGLDSSHFGLHSLRAGGASAAAGIGVPDRLFRRHGRWKSDSSKDRYVKESLEHKMLVSRNLGI